MKQRTIAWVIAILVLVVPSCSNVAQSSGGALSGLFRRPPSLTLINNSGQDICYFFISPTTSQYWGEDQLGRYMVPNGDSFVFSLTAGTYDLLAEDCFDNIIAEQREVDIDGPVTWRITEPESTGEATPGTDDEGGADDGYTGGGSSGGNTPITVNNHSDQTICHIYTSCSTDEGFPIEHLGSGVIVSGASRTFHIDTAVTTNPYQVSRCTLTATDCDHNIISYRMEIYINGPYTWDIGGAGR